MKLFSKIKEQGFAHTLELLFNRVVPAWVFRFSTGDVFELDTTQLSIVYENLDNSGFDMRCVSDPQERKDLRRSTWNSVPLKTSKNDYGYAISKSEDPSKILGGVWGGINSFQESNLGFQLQFQDFEGWIYCAYVDEQSRGLGIYKRLLSFAARDLNEKGHSRLLVIVQPWNRASTYIHKKYSKANVGRISVVRILNLAFVFRKGKVMKNRTFTSQVSFNPVQLSVARSAKSN